MAGKIKDRTGQRQGKLTFLHICGRDEKGLIWLAICECGQEKKINTNSIKSQSCGCLKKIGYNKSHGQSGENATYRAWTSMRNRCDNPKNKGYNDYGGRGIKYSKRWNSYELFLKDMGSKPLGMSLDRIDVDGNYCLKNCRWATARTQQNNTRSNVYYTYLGERKSKKEWSRELNVHVKVFEYWLHKIGFEETCRLGLSGSLPKKKVNILTFNGKLESLSSVAFQLGIDRKSLKKLLTKHSLEEISENIDSYRTVKMSLPDYLQGVSKKNHEYNSTYLMWHEIKAWCFNKNHRNYQYYGTKGISIDPAWLNDLDQFIKDVGKKPKHRILRLKNENEDFKKENVHWVGSSIPITKNPNKNRTKKFYQYKGIRDSHNGWAKRLKITPRKLDYYIGSRGSFKNAYELLTSKNYKGKPRIFYIHEGEKRSVSKWATYLCINEKKFRKLLKENPFEEIIVGLLKERKTNEKKQFKHEIKGYTSPKSEFYYTWLTWQRILERCSNKNHKDYSNYGGRGIKVCFQWKKSFAIFLKDVGKKPPGLSLDRIDVNGNYTPENCQWANNSKQANNTRSNSYYTKGKIKKTLSQWATFLGITRFKLRYWINKIGWESAYIKFIENLNI